MSIESEKPPGSSTAAALPYATRPRRRRGEFWHRQFDDSPTRGQQLFDYLLAYAATPVCLYFDPVIFTVDGVLPEIRSLAWSFVLLQLVAFSAWKLIQRTAGRRSVIGPPQMESPVATPRPALRWSALLLAGLLSAGAVIAGGLGILMAPLAVIGLMFGIGVLGFTPLAVGLAWFRNALRALRFSGMKAPSAPALLLCLLGGTTAFVIPGMVWEGQAFAVSVLARDLSPENSPAAERAEHFLRNWGWALDPQRVALRYAREHDANRRAQLARAYELMTGEHPDLGFD